jgi:hypothetical protein
MILKLNSGVNSRQGPGHGSRRSMKDKSCYYHNFKTRLDDQPRQCPTHRLRGSTWVNQSQHIDKNYYYHSFKT